MAVSLRAGVALRRVQGATSPRLPSSSFPREADPPLSGKGMLRSFFPLLLPVNHAEFHRPPCDEQWLNGITHPAPDHRSSFERIWGTSIRRNRMSPGQAGAARIGGCPPPGPEIAFPLPAPLDAPWAASAR